VRAASILLALIAARSWGSVEVLGSGHLGSSRIEDLLAAPPDLARLGRDDRESWRLQASEAVVAAAHDQGRLDATCEVVVVRRDTSTGDFLVRADLKEGPLYTFGRISTEFPEVPGSAPALAPEPSVRAGQVFQQAKVNRLVQEVQRFYQQMGWLDAAVSYDLSVRRDSQKVDARLEVRLGRMAIFDGIHVHFKDRHLTSGQRLVDLWSVERGDTIRNGDLQKYNRKLAQTRLFSTAKVSRRPATGDSGRTAIDVDVAERVPGTIEFSLSWEPTYGWGVGGLVRHRNVQGTFNELSLQGKDAQYVQNLRAGHYNPLLLGSPIALDDGITVQQQERGLGDASLFREFTVSGDGTFSYIPTDWSNVSLKLSAQRDTKYDTIGTSKVTYQIASDLGWTLDFRDEPFDPMSGWSLRTDFGWGDQFYPRDTTWTWIQAQARAYQPLFWRFLSAYALEGGRFLSPTTFDGSKVFWMGGPRTVRSYGFDQLRAAKTDSADGLEPRYVRASAELRANLPWGFQAVGFVDWARIWNTGQAPDLLDPDKAWWAYGPGIRYHLTLLTFRLDYSFGRGVWAFDLAQAI
jgi:outer membrane protein assembly factor BamA